VSDGGSYIKHTNSKEIENIINIIYGTKSEDKNFNRNQKEKHAKIAEYIDAFEKPKFSFWKK
jgi:hypothetical protein